MTSLTDQNALNSRMRGVWFGLRAGGLRLLRGGRNLREHASGAPRLARVSRVAATDWPVAAGASRTPLWNAKSGAEWRLTAGKVQNLRVAARRLNGLVIPAGGVFSFWRALGRPSRWRGYVAGRELREGCMVASTGGGLCQLSNALYAAALEAGMQIVERHAHSKIVPGSLAERGLDATVFWNYVDLRFRAPVDCVLEVALSASHLNVQLRTRVPVAAPKPDRFRVSASPPKDHAHDCVGCAQEDCVEYIAPEHRAGRSAWLLDEVWPEFDRWLGAHARAGDTIALPMDGKRRGRAAYAWTLDGVPRVRVREHVWLAAARGLGTRLLGAQGAARQRALLRLDTALAHAYARGLATDIDHAVVSLNLLPHLWRAGVLGGRQVSVLMNRSPLALLHAQLDRASALHPDSATLNDFRADADLVDAEEVALQAATRVVTPHRAVAQYARSRYRAAVEELEWQAADAREPARRGGGVLFPASALGRKGAYEVRAACRELDLPVLVLGRAQEDARFWQGVNAMPVDARDPWANVACVALPAFVEHRPRLLLQARSRGLPVVCSGDCGLPDDLPGVRQVPAGAVPELVAALELAAA